MTVSVRVISLCMLVTACAANREVGAQSRIPDAGRPAALRPVPHRAALVPDSRAAFMRRDDVWSDDHQVVYRDTAATIRVRSLVDGHEIATTRSAGRILCGSGDRLALLRTEAPASISTLVAPRRVVLVDLRAGTEQLSAPLPLPQWVVTTSENEPAETFVAWFDGNDVVIAWQAALGWRGGVAPPNEEAARVRRASGSFRVDVSAQFVTGGAITIQQASPSRSPIPSRSNLQQLEGGDGLFWLNEFEPRMGMTRYAFVDSNHAERVVTFGATSSVGIVQIDGVWARGDRVIVVRQFASEQDRYSLPRTLDVLDRATGRSLWHDEVAVLHMMPPRP